MLNCLCSDRFGLGWAHDIYLLCTTYAYEFSCIRSLHSVYFYIFELFGGFLIVSFFPLSHYNSITGPRSWFLLSFLKHLTIDFPSHFILSILDVYRDTATHDKLIFPSAITQILCHFSVPFPSSDHFSIMCLIDYATIKRSEAQFKSRQSDSAAPPSRSALSRSTPSSSTGDVALGDIMTQL